MHQRYRPGDIVCMRLGPKHSMVVARYVKRYDFVLRKFIASEDVWCTLYTSLHGIKERIVNQNKLKFFGNKLLPPPYGNSDMDDR